MDQNPTPERRLQLIFMSEGTVNALLGAAITLIYLGLLPVEIHHFNIPDWTVGVLGVTWFFSGVGVVALAATHVNK